jgi:hypothetical protein
MVAAVGCTSQKDSACMSQENEIRGGCGCGRKEAVHHVVLLYWRECVLVCACVFAHGGREDCSLWRTKFVGEFLVRLHIETYAPTSL